MQIDGVGNGYKNEKINEEVSIPLAVIFFSPINCYDVGCIMYCVLKLCMCLFVYNLFDNLLFRSWNERCISFM